MYALPRRLPDASFSPSRTSSTRAAASRISPSSFAAEIPEELRPQIGNAVIGCDICQDVCPWNRKAPAVALAAFEPRERLFSPELEWLSSLSQEEFSAVFRKSAVKHAKVRRGIVRNACVALGNSAGALEPAVRERVSALLDQLAHSGDEIIASHTRWALARLSDLDDRPAHSDRSVETGKGAK